MIQPSRKAIQVARKIAAPFYGALHVEPDDRKILDIAAALEAYAIERIAQRDPTYDQLRAERDAALARAQTAEDVGARYTSSAALQNAVVDRLAVAEERVRMLEKLADLWESQAGTYPTTSEHAAAAVRLCARELRNALAKAAGGQGGTR